METNITFILNQKIVNTQVHPATVLLDFIRKNKKLTGTKEVCKEGDCGACAVLLGELDNGSVKYKVINSCLYPMLKINGKHIVTIEGLNNDELSPIQESFLKEGASQCGFCTPGFIVSFTGYLLNTENFNSEDAINSVGGNICRCTGYHSIIRAISNVGNQLDVFNTDKLIELGVVPSFFEGIESKLNLLNENKQSGNNFKNKHLVSGGTDLFVQKPDELLHCNIQLGEQLIDPDIKISENTIVINGSATVTDFQNFIEQNNINIYFKKLLKLFASLPIRNSATLAGNIVNASPIADLTITLLALDAELTLLDQKNKTRIIPLNKFYAGYKKLNKSSDEFIQTISFKIPTKNTKFNFEKVSKRTHLDIASVNSAIKVTTDSDNIMNATISAGGVSPIPLYLEETSLYLNNKVINNDLVNEAVRIAQNEISPISDIRGTKQYKNLLLGQLIKAHFIELFPNIITNEVLV